MALSQKGPQALQAGIHSIGCKSSWRRYKFQSIHLKKIRGGEGTCGIIGGNPSLGNWKGPKTATKSTVVDDAMHTCKDPI